MEFEYAAWVNDVRLDIRWSVTGEVFTVDHFFVQAYGWRTSSDGCTLVDEAFCRQHPVLLPSSTRARLLKRFAN
jgi:hypothetical protein